MSQTLKNILITGANRGLGLGFTKHYLQQGAQVFATCRSTSPELETLRKEFKTLQTLTMDVSNVESVRQGIAELSKYTESLDLLINNAGRLGKEYHNIFDDIDEADSVETLKSNTLGPMWVTKAAIPFLKKGTGKKVISITSGLGSIGDNQSSDYYIYRISKAGLNMLNRNLAVDLKPFDITCIALCPGWVKTDMGTQAAPLTVEQSIRSMTDTIDRVTLKDSGSYLQRTGEKYASY